MKLNKNTVFFTGGGTGGHIYPGLAVAEQLHILAETDGQELKISWIGCSKGMDCKIVCAAQNASGKQTVDKFYGIPAGKLRRYFSLKNLSDLFRIIGGFFCALHILRKNKPAALFSKGGFVSVPPCLAAKMLRIPVFTHECDFTLGLANRINFKSADTMFVSYEETKNALDEGAQKRVMVTGNPVRPVFYGTKPERGLDFLQIPQNHTKPVLLVLGGSSGAKQINNLIYENIDWLCERFIVVHQTGLINTDTESALKNQSDFTDYKPYDFIYSQMPDVVSCADVILSRAGANSIWEAAVLRKPMVLVPLCGSGTRGDQVDNALFFQKKNAALVLLREQADSAHLQETLEKMLDKTYRESFSKALDSLVPAEPAAKKIAAYIYQQIKNCANGEHNEP